MNWKSRTFTENSLLPRCKIRWINRTFRTWNWIGLTQTDKKNSACKHIDPIMVRLHLQEASWSDQQKRIPDVKMQKSPSFPYFLSYYVQTDEMHDPKSSRVGKWFVVCATTRQKTSNGVFKCDVLYGLKWLCLQKCFTDKNMSRI